VKLAKNGINVFGKGKCDHSTQEIAEGSAKGGKKANAY
jgi:hypothetical protein